MPARVAPLTFWLAVMNMAFGRCELLAMRLSDLEQQGNNVPKRLYFAFFLSLYQKNTFG